AMMSLPPTTGLRRWTYHCCIGLLAVAGLRLGEAIRLRRGDVDLEEGVLTIHHSKFGKSRIVPVHATTVTVLGEYAERRDASSERRGSEFFLVGEHGGRLHKQNIQLVFIKSLRQIGLRGPAGSGGPRIHGLRHTYAVRALLHWYRAGEDVERLLPVLSTYLGHTHTRDTYWYLTACPELMSHAVMRLESRWEVAQ
ncbi:tyrosine-type recombinase/integrase, partial [Allomesorhizobium camelthorni]